MFYLNFLRNIFLSSKTKVSLFLLISGIFFATIVFRAPLHKYFASMVSSDRGGVYHILVRGDQDYSYLATKLSDFPGIDHVEITSEGDLGINDTQIAKELEVELPKDLIESNHTVFSVHMSSMLGRKNLSLIKEYISRIVGKNNIVTSSEYSEVNRQAMMAEQETSILENLDLYLIALICFVWNVLFYLVSVEIKKHAYVYQAYRRNGSTSFNFLSLLLISMIVISTAIGAVLTSINILEVSALIAFVLLLSYLATRRVRWN